MKDFDWNADSHSMTNAFWLAKMSFLAYAPNRSGQKFPADGKPLDEMKEDPKAKREDMGLVDAECWYRDVNDTQVMVCGHNLGLVVAFRGSETNDLTDFGDWTDDAHARYFIHSTPFAVHMGFHFALERVRVVLAEYLLSRLSKQERPVWITGHSLGGALATLSAAYLLAHYGIRAKGVYTYAAPRVGDPVWAAWYEREFGQFTFRYANFADPAPDLPPPPKYMQAGRLRFIHKDGVCVTEENELARLETQFQMFPQEPWVGINFNDHPHQLRLYVDALTASRDALLASVRIESIIHDPPGDDLLEERVEFVSQAPADLDLSGWALRDSQGHRFQFPAFVVKPDQRFRVRTGAGTNGPDDLYWGRRQAVWNNQVGDTATLVDSHGQVVARFTYSAS